MIHIIVWWDIVEMWNNRYLVSEILGPSFGWILGSSKHTACGPHPDTTRPARRVYLFVFCGLKCVKKKEMKLLVVYGPN